MFFPKLSLMGAVLFSVAGQAFAAADVAVSVQGPASTMVYTFRTYTVRMNNLGNQHAAGVSLRVDLPQTATSPQVAILGQVASWDSRCQLINRGLTCQNWRNPQRQVDVGKLSVQISRVDACFEPYCARNVGFFRKLSKQ
jgi:hypothetical protein